MTVLQARFTVQYVKRIIGPDGAVQSSEVELFSSIPEMVGDETAPTWTIMKTFMDLCIKAPASFAEFEAFLPGQEYEAVFTRLDPGAVGEVGEKGEE